MTTLTTLSYIHVGNHHKEVPPSVSNEERLRMFRAVWPVQLGNNVFNYGGGGVESGHAREVSADAYAAGRVQGHGQRAEADQPSSRSNALPASTLYGANARVDGNRNESLLGVPMQGHFDRCDSQNRSPWNTDKPEIDTGRSTLTPRSLAMTLPKSRTGGIPGFLSGGERYALEQSPIDDDEAREAAEFEFGVALDAS